MTKVWRLVKISVLPIWYSYNIGWDLSLLSISKSAPLFLCSHCWSKSLDLRKQGLIIPQIINGSALVRLALDILAPYQAGHSAKHYCSLFFLLIFLSKLYDLGSNVNLQAFVPYKSIELFGSNEWLNLVCELFPKCRTVGLLSLRIQ